MADAKTRAQPAHDGARRRGRAGASARRHQTIDVAPALAGTAGAIGAAQTAVGNLRTTANAQVGGVSLPSGFRQSLLQAANQLDTFLDDLGRSRALITQGKALFDALDAIVGHPEQLGDCCPIPVELKHPARRRCRHAIAPLRTTVGRLPAARRARRARPSLDAIDIVQQVLDARGRPAHTAGDAARATS